ncbi:DUF732 domain-containing protein [Nonomuraea sp. 3-1Str]|uniref:DUF732 domain-containing protein n=1 Tax=Nonomuraea sp. 3-1Str TaxID=2929801 RepID=UPI00285C942D|nr:DUF732 domain-containing protein [Nonomuraea sp. 3-1Str]MDR8410970.1 DUF732 domain-containing protein [Nonomuraea sp. 3-1Str]
MRRQPTPTETPEPQVSAPAGTGGGQRRTRVLAVAGTALVAGVSVVLVVTSLVPETAGPDQAYLHRLERIAPWLAPEEGAALSRARATCRDILDGKPGEELVSDAQERFTDVTREQAAEIVDAVKEWCLPPATSFAN